MAGLDASMESSLVWMLLLGLVDCDMVWIAVGCGDLLGVASMETSEGSLLLFVFNVAILITLGLLLVWVGASLLIGFVLEVNAEFFFWNKTVKIWIYLKFYFLFV